MDRRSLQGSYETPVIADYGDLREVTRTTHLMLRATMDPTGTGAQDLSFSGSTSPGDGSGGGGGDTAGGATPGNAPDGGDVAGAGVSGSDAGSVADDIGGVAGDTGGVPGDVGSGASGGEDAGDLPFTGLAAGVIGAAGAALAGGGAALRRAARRDR